MDDGESFSHQQGELVWREFQAAVLGKRKKKGTLQIQSIDRAKAHPDNAVDRTSLVERYDGNNAFAETIKDVKVERIVVVGLEKQPKEIIKHRKNQDPEQLAWDWDSSSNALTIKNPTLRIVDSTLR